MYYFIFLNVVQWRRGVITASGYRTDINRRYYLLIPLVEKLKLSGAGGTIGRTFEMSFKIWS